MWFAERHLAPGVRAGFTGGVRDAEALAVGAPGNLSHTRPHVPAQVAAARADVARRFGVDVEDLHFMRQVHGRAVGYVSSDTPRGAELRGVDALVTDQVGRALCVQVADCVPVLLGSTAGPVAAVHAGRKGVELGVLDAALEALAELGAEPATLQAAIGPAIGGCCYEVPEAMQRDVVADHPRAEAMTTWGTPSLDLPAAVTATLEDAGVSSVEPSPGCTRCDPEQRWFSHRADPNTGRQIGLVVRVEAP